MARSVIIMVMTARNAGMAYRPSAPPTTAPQVKMGSRPMVMPLARIVATVTSVLTPAMVTDTTNTMIVMAKASMAGGACTDRGA